MNMQSTELQTLLAQLEGHPLPSIDLKLDRMLHFLTLLGNPERRLPPVIHIAGTNGKGSVTAFIDACAQAMGKRMHRYTSPHLVRFNERIVIAGRQASDAALIAGLEQLMPLLSDYPLTYFESTTALALMLFAEHPADLCLLEVGMGGRLDATNVVDTPLCTVITPVSYDHQEFLGDTLAKIAAEKAGIIKPYIPCVVGAQEPEALAVIKDVAKRNHAPLKVLGEDFHYHIQEDGRWTYQSTHAELTLPKPALQGNHQYHNAAVAIAVIEQCFADIFAENIAAEGITKAQWAARMQPLPAYAMQQLFGVDVPVLLDGGHNPSSAAMLAEWLRAQAESYHLVFGMHKDKDAAAVLALLAPHLVSISTITIPNDIKAYDAVQLAALARQYHPNVLSCDTLQQAMQVTQAEKSPILIYGSLYLAGHVLGMIEKVLPVTDAA